MTIYLAGPIGGCTDAECKDWREAIKARYPQHNFLDPMARDCRGREDGCAAEIVEGDKADIRKSDLLLAYCPKPSPGTSMEIFFAHLIGVYVVAVVEGGISPWIAHHADQLFTSLDDLVF